MWKVIVVIALLILMIVVEASKLLKDEYWRDLLINPILDYANSTDNLHRNESIRAFFTDSELETLHEVVTEFLLYPNEQLWKPVGEVSIERPFILFHQRKAGGSSLRATLERAGKILELPYFIPCAGINCDLYTFPYSSKYAIYAGHFKWGTQGDFARFNTSHRSEFSCATNFRHPFSRIESCLYYRFFDRLKGRCVMDMPMDEFREMFLDTDEYGSSCINEPFRVLSGVNDEVVIDNLMHGKEDSFRRQRRQLVSSYAMEVFKQTVKHIQRCPPVVLEIAETYDILAETIPKLGRVGAFEATAMEKVGSKSRKICDHLEGDYLEVVKEYAGLEMILYDAVVRKSLVQIATKYSDYLFHMKCIDGFPKRDYLTLVQSKGAPIALVGNNNDDTFNIRTLIEHSTGFYMGSIRSRREYSTYFPGDSFCGKRMVAVFAEISNFLVRPDYNASSSAKLEYYYASSIRKCKRGMIPHFTKGAILALDPFFIIWKKLELFDNVDDVTQSLKGFILPSLQDLANPPSRSAEDASTTTTTTARRARRQLAAQSFKKSSSTSQSLGFVVSGKAPVNREDEKFEDEDAELHRKNQNKTQSLINSVTSSIQEKQKSSDANHTAIVLTEAEHEFFFYQKMYSLLFDFQTYSWLFRYSYLEALKANDMSLLTSREKYLNLVKNSPEVPQYPMHNFAFYSIDSVIDGAHVLSVYAKEHSTLSKKTNTYVHSSDFTTTYSANNNPFLNLLQYTNYSEYLQPHRVHCAFSHIKSQAQLGASRLKDFQSMKTYYKKRPKVLQQVKEIVLQWLKPLNLHADQFHLFYDLKVTNNI